MRGAAALLLALATVPAAAIGGDEQAYTRRVVQDYGACMVSHHHDRLKAFVLSTDESIRPPTPRETCVFSDGMLRMSGVIYRMVFAEALLRRGFRAGLPPGLGAGRENEPGAPIAATAYPGVLEHVQRLERLGRCVAYRRPADAYRLLATRPARDEEGAAMSAMMPVLTACGVRSVLPQPIGNVRGTIAVNLYRAAVAASAGESTGPSGAGEQHSLPSSSLPSNSRQ